MTFTDRLSELSDFQRKFFKKTENIKDMKVLQEMYLNEAPTAKDSTEQERSQDQLFWKMLGERLQNNG